MSTPAVTASVPYDPELHPHIKSGPTGGQFAPKGKTGGPAASTAPKAAPPKKAPAKSQPAAKTTKPAAKPPGKKAAPAAHGRQPVLHQGGVHNDSARVKDLQALLGELGLGKVPVDGQYGPQTRAAVMAAQRKLGLKPTGRAGSGLIRRLHDAHALSPCVPKSGSKVHAAAAYTLDDEDAVLVDELPGDEYDVQLWSDGSVSITEDGEDLVLDVPSDVMRLVQAGFNPSELRVGHGEHGGEWTHNNPAGALIDALKKAGGETSNSIYFDDGRYIDWSVQTADLNHLPDRARQLEIGDNDNAVQIDMSGHEERSLFHALTLTVMADEGHPQSHHLAALAGSGHENLVFAGGGDLDWSVKNPDGSRVIAASDGNDSIDFELTADEFRKWQASLGITQLQDNNAPNAIKAALGHDVTPGHDELHHYWVAGKGRELWIHSPTPWTTLVALLTPHVGPEKAKVFASRWFIETHGYSAGSDKNRVAHGHPPRGHNVGPG